MIIHGSHYKRRNKSYKTDRIGIKRGGKRRESRKREGRRGHGSCI